MLDKALVAGPRRHRFLNVSTGECIRTDLLLPDLADHTLHAVTNEGLLLLLHRPSLVIRLLNPLTRRLTDLPPATTLMTEQQLSRSRQGGGDLGERLSVYSAGLAVADDDASTTVMTVAIYFRFPMGIAVAKPGDQCWTLVHDRYVTATLSFAGRFYCTIGTSVMVLEDSSATTSDHPRLVMAVKPSFHMSGMADSLHLVDNAGELMLVHRLLCKDDNDDAHGEKYKMDYRVYRVDLDAGALVPAKSLNGRAVFIGRRRAISVRAGAFSSVSADTLYLGSDCDEKTTMNKIQAYNVADGSAQPYHHDSCIDMVQPYGVVDCISHCIMGSGRHLL
ncbi:hypothetical protein BDA96_02G364800 [Sorghum bicolor]|uniref:KIB1-4 beta-propeller domain-containing protein n=2 Tax=Sorghum bicolor TaxID=4558 RepID=A0A921RSQ1_SORBI|nr:hypothetical protein BDA96_02G364800 [Sorghum bicolor]OQU90141.1 hypothetical protein SORBI_3002G347800 [Sorghum bicolor]